MQYALLIYGTGDSGYDRLTEPELLAMYDEHYAFMTMLTERKALGDSMELADVSSARSVRHRADGITVTDGPYAESKEVLGGFYVVDAQDLDEALEYARALPTRPGDIVEVRPRAMSGGS